MLERGWSGQPLVNSSHRSRHLAEGKVPFSPLNLIVSNPRPLFEALTIGKQFGCRKSGWCNIFSVDDHQLRPLLFIEKMDEPRGHQPRWKLVAFRLDQCAHMFQIRACPRHIMFGPTRTVTSKSMPANLMFLGEW